MSINKQTIMLARKLRIELDTTVNATTRLLVRRWAEAWDTLHEAWSDAAMDVAAMAHAGRAPTITQILRLDHAERALLEANQSIADLADYTGVTVRDAVGRVIQDTPGWDAEIIASQYPPGVDRAALAAQFNRVDPVAMQMIVERTTERITSSTWTLSALAQHEMRQTLIRGVTLGQNPRATARRMVARARGAFNGGLTRALVIARTEMLDAYRAASMETGLANRDVLAGWTWVAQLDTRTCPSCWGMHGTEHPLTEPGPLDHHQGRCARMPRTKTWAELGFHGIEEPPPVLPDATAVFDALPPEDQMKILGPGRLLAYQAGAPLSDMSSMKVNRGWRTSYVPTPVSYLLRRYPTV